MADWDSFKAQRPNDLIAVRLGDFFEFFFQDAPVVAQRLNVTLTHRRETPMAGFSWHSASARFAVLREAGFAVSVVDINPDTGKRDFVDNFLKLQPGFREWVC